MCWDQEVGYPGVLKSVCGVCVVQSFIVDHHMCRYIQDGYYIGLTGFVCKHERGVAVRQMLKDGVIPLSRLLLETDAPFMTPPLPVAGYNGLDARTRTNEPCTLPLVAETVADMCGVSVEEVASVTTANVGAVFKVYV